MMLNFITKQAVLCCENLKGCFEGCSAYETIPQVFQEAPEVCRMKSPQRYGSFEQDKDQVDEDNSSVCSEQDSFLEQNSYRKHESELSYRKEESPLSSDVHTKQNKKVRVPKQKVNYHFGQYQPVLWLTSTQEAKFVQVEPTDWDPKTQYYPEDLKLLFPSSGEIVALNSLSYDVVCELIQFSPDTAPVLHFVSRVRHKVLEGQLSPESKKSIPLPRIDTSRWRIKIVDDNPNPEKPLDPPLRTLGDLGPKSESAKLAKRKRRNSNPFAEEFFKERPIKYFEEPWFPSSRIKIKNKFYAAEIQAEKREKELKRWKLIADFNYLYMDIVYRRKQLEENEETEEVSSNPEENRIFNHQILNPPTSPPEPSLDVSDNLGICNFLDE